MTQTRTLSMSSSGRFVAVRRPGAIEVLDALGASPRRTLERDPTDFAIVGDALWVLGTDAIERFTTDGVRPIDPAIAIGAGALRLHACSGEAVTSALVTGSRSIVVDGVQSF